MAARFDALTAAHAGTCSVCGHHFAVGRSEIRSLPVPMPMNPAVTTWYEDRGSWLVHNALFERMHRRRWAHRRCAERLDRKYTVDEQVALAEEWHDELVRKKADAQDAHEHRFGKPRAPSRRARHAPRRRDAR